MPPRSPLARDADRAFGRERQRHAVVLDVTDSGVDAIDMSTGSLISVVSSSTIGRKPVVGDTWTITQVVYGTWSLGTLIAPARVDFGAATFAEIVEHLGAIGLFRYEPWDTTDVVVERPHLAYLGEARLFPTGFAPKGWIKCDGGSHLRSRYRDLWECDAAPTLLSSGDGSTTFTTPSLATVGPFSWYICAE